MDYGPIIAAVVCALFFYRVGQQEKAPPAVWTVLSVIISFLSMRFTAWGVWGVLGGQLLLFAGITLFRLWRGDAAPSD